MKGMIEQLSISKGGVPKLPIAIAHVEALGIVGDVQKNTKYHGGPRQALLLLTAEGLEELQAKGFPVYAGALGENVTLRGIPRTAIGLGSRLRLGLEVEVEVTKMREPCKTLSPYGEGIQKAVYDAKVRAGDRSSPLWGLAGFYVRVLQGGTVMPGDVAELVEA